jgi:hypothetical protein
MRHPGITFSMMTADELITKKNLEAFKQELFAMPALFKNAQSWPGKNDSERKI